MALGAICENCYQKDVVDKTRLEINAAMKEHQEISKKVAELLLLRQRVSILRTACESYKETLDESSMELSKVRSYNDKKEEKLKRAMSRDFNKNLSKSQSECDKKEKNLINEKHDLIKLRKNFISQLMKTVFPIRINKQQQQTTTNMAPQDHTLCDYEVIDDDKNNPLISRNITTTTYDNIIHYGSLPSDGNMTDYSRAVKLKALISSDASSNSETCHDNNDLTLTVPVAVSFVAHAVYIIANVLDQKLPYSLILPVVLCEYGRADRKSQAIVRFLAKLDDNLMFLCFTQNVPLNMIQVGHTIRNLSTLVSHDELGRSGPFTCHPELLRYQLVSKKRHLLMDEDEDHPPLLHSAHEEEEDKLQNPDDSSEDESDSEQIENATTVGEDWEEVHEMMIPPHFHPGLYGERLEYGTLYSDYSHQTIQSESKQQDMYSNESVQSSIGLFDTLSSLLGSGWSKK